MSIENENGNFAKPMLCAVKFRMMYNISVRRATETNYGLVSKNGKPMEFNNEDEARLWGRENIEGKSMWIVSWFVSKA